MILTNDGKKFYKLATKIISSIHEAISELKNSHKKCIVNIGFCPSIMIFDLIEQLRYANFKMDCIRFHEFNAKRQLIALKNNHIDISITRGVDTASSEGLEQIIPVSYTHLNQRLPAPKAGALPGCATLRKKTRAVAARENCGAKDGT